jgi:hypothetical protein
MSKFIRYPVQAVLYGLFALVVGYFSTSPPYRLLEDGQGLLRLSLRHPGQLLVECRHRSAEELAKMPPNMRVSADCPRARSPVTVRVELDGKAIIDDSYPPAGLSKDGASAAYSRLPIPAGQHQLHVQINDNQKVQGYTHDRQFALNVKPGQIVLIDFQPELGGVIIR